MRTMRREICWLALLTVVAISTVAIRAAYSGGRWASPEALGDVVISFDDVVRFYGNTGNSRGDISVTGTNRGLAFDAALNLFVANTNLAALDPDKRQGIATVSEQSHALGYIKTQDNPQSIVLAGNEDYFVASRVSTTQALIRQFNKIARICPGTPTPLVATATCDFTVTVDSTGTCVGIDLDADQTTLNIVDGATGTGVTRLIRRLNVSTGATLSSITLPSDNKAAACAIRTLPPARGSNLTTGGYLVADKDNIKRVGPAGGQVGNVFVAGSSSPSDDNWIDVELDPNTFALWGLNASAKAADRRATKFNLASPSSGVQSISLAAFAPARGLTVNGALRAAQTIRLLDVTQNNLSITIPAFNLGTDYAHTWQIKPETTQPVSAFLSVQAVEGRSDGIPAQDEVATPANNLDGICPVSLDLDCRINEFFPESPAKTYSRNRAVFYNVTELQQTPVSSTVQLLIKVMRAVYAAPLAGAACVPGGPTQPASAILRDKYPHTSSTQAGYSVFTEDGTILFGSLIKRTFNHYIAVDRQNTLYSAFMVKPTGDQNIGSTLQVAVVIRDPTTNCSVVSGLVESDTLAVAFLDVAALTIIADSEGVSTGLATSGLEFVEAAGQYRANVTLTNPPFVVGRTYRACVTAKADPDNPPAQRAIGEVCSPNFKVGTRKK